MNLYEIMLQHYAPKDSKKGIATYLVANSDEKVYEWLCSDPKLIDGRWIICSYNDREEDGESYDVYDNDYNCVASENFKERMIRLQGEMNDDEVELSDLYYGKTLYGWKLVSADISRREIDMLLELGIAVEVS